MNNFLPILELCVFYIEYRTVKFSKKERQLTFVVEPMLNILCKHSFCDFVDTAKVSSLPLLKITTKPKHFLPVKKKIPILWIGLQTNKIQKVSKPYI